MGQALRRLRSPTGVSAARPSPPPQATQSNSPHVEAPAGVASQASKASLRQSVEVKPQAPEPQYIIEPGQNIGDWDRGDPKYSVMVQQVVGKISTRPGSESEMGTAHVSSEFRRPKPMNRHTTAATGPDEEKVVTSGSLNIAGIREVLLLHQGLSEGQEKPLDAEALSKKYNVDVELLEGLFQYTTLPAPQTPEDSSQTPQRKLRKA